MKKLLSVLTCLMLGALPGFASETDDYYAYSYARMSYVNGDVFIQRAGDMGYEEGAVNLPLVENDKLGTQDGRAEVHFGKKNYLRIDRFTQIDLAALPKQGNDSISLHLLSGNVFLRVSYLEREKDFEIHTPDASYYILDVGLYRFSVQENQQTELRVLEGAVEAAGEEGSILVEANEAVIASNGRLNSGLNANYASYEDDFSSWNRTRDAAITRYTANKNYLPNELSDYEHELAYHGRWVYERPYGHVWVPNVYDSGWRPYWNGRWVWYPIIGWTWVSYEPWGWCVSHYGRWHWRLGLGWYWIPTARWGPAWVHWYHGYDYYGWCPLSYYNRPVVIVNNHFYGNYYNNYYPVNSRALTVVHKSQLQNRNVSRVALSSSSVSRLGKIALSNKQPTLNPVFNKSSLSNSKAARVLARSDVREVNRSFSKSASISSGSSSSSSRIRSQGISSSGSAQIKRIPSSSSSSTSSGSSRIIQRESSTRSALGSSSAISSRSSSGTPSRTSIRTYPSSGITSDRSRISRSSPSSSTSRTIQPSNKSFGINSRSSTSSSRSSSIRSYPSSRSIVSPSRSENNTSRYSSRSSSSPSGATVQQSTGSSSNFSPDRSISSNSYSSRSSEISRYPSRSTSSSYSSSGSSSNYSPTRRISPYSSSSSSRYTSPSGSYTSRSSSSYSSGSRTTYSSPSRSISTSRYTSPSRSYSNVGSSSSSSRYTAPARSSSSSSRSSISSSRSHGSSSISRSSSSRSSSHSSSSSRRKK